MYQKENIIQRIMHSLVKMKLWFSCSLYCFLLHKCTLISLCALLPDCAKLYIYTQIYIYIYIYEKEIYSFSTTDMFLFYCWIKLVSELHLPLVINYCNGLGQWSESHRKFVFLVTYFMSSSPILNLKILNRFHLNTRISSVLDEHH